MKRSCLFLLWARVGFFPEFLLGKHWFVCEQSEAHLKICSVAVPIIWDSLSGGLPDG